MEPLLSCRSLTAGYGRKPILREISCTFPRSEITAILGPNGGGKSTLLRVLGGALPYFTGEIDIAGRSYRSMRPTERARLVALVPQVYPQLLPLTVNEALQISRYPNIHHRGERATSNDAFIQAALTAMDIEHLSNQRCDTLSGGEQRKMLIAQGLAQLGCGLTAGGQDTLLLLDEPVAFLDPPAQAATLRKLAQIVAEQRLTVALVLHDLALARIHASHVVLLRDGTVLTEGDPPTVMTASKLAFLYDCEPAELEYAGVA